MQQRPGSSSASRLTCRSSLSSAEVYGRSGSRTKTLACGDRAAEARIPRCRRLCRFITDHLGDPAVAEPRVFNLGNPENAVTIHDLALRLRGLLGSSSEIVFTDGATVDGPAYEEAESFEKLPHVRNASELGWAPRVGLDELIEQTAGYKRVCADRRALSAAEPRPVQA